MQKIKTTFAIIIVYAAIFASYPYAFGQFISLPSNKMVWIISYCVLIVLLLSVKKAVKTTSILEYVVFIQIVGWLFFSIIHNDSSYYTRIFLILWSYTVILLFGKLKTIDRFCDFNNKIICAQTVLGAVAFALCLTGLLKPLFYYDNVDGRNAAFFGLTCSNAVYGNFIRPSGFFDEPGALACWGVYSLLVNKLYFHNKKIEYALMFSLLFTFSMAYYIQLIAYLLMFYTKYSKKLIALCFLLGIIGFTIYQKAQDDADLYYITIRRIEDAANGTTNRNNMTEAAHDVFLGKPLIGIGSINASKNAEPLTDNPYETLATDGILGTLIIYFPYILLMVKYRRNKELVKACAIFAVGFLQRPFHGTLLHYLTMYLFVYLTINYNKISLKYAS